MCARSAPWWSAPATAATARSRFSPPTIGGSATPTRFCASASNAIRPWCDALQNEGVVVQGVMRGHKRVEDARERAYHPRIHLLRNKLFTKVDGLSGQARQ